MTMVDPESLSATLDALNDAFFYDRFLWKPTRYEAAKWIAGRQGLPGAYANMFAPTAKEIKEGIRLFTGEKISTSAGARHILGEEACRALIVLKVPGRAVHNALNHATIGMTERLHKAKPGIYCCAKCTCVLWRHLAVGGLEDANPEQWLAAGMKALKARRDGKGKWKRFPFYYTLLALSEIDLPGALDEMQYAAPVCELELRESTGTDKYTQRRELLAKRILARC